MSEKIHAEGIFKEIKTPKEGLFFLVFETKNGQKIEPGGFTKQCPAPALKVGQNYKFTYTKNGNYTNIFPKFRGKKIVGWKIEPVREQDQEGIEAYVDNGTTKEAPNSKLLNEIKAVKSELAGAQQLIQQALSQIKNKQSSEYWEKRDASIIRQACIKAAAQIIANQKTESIEQATEKTIEMAQAFAEYCAGEKED